MKVRTNNNSLKVYDLNSDYIYLKTRIKRMRSKALNILIVALLFIGNNWVQAQDKTYNLIKIGIKGFAGGTEKTYLNTMSSKWIEGVADASGAELMNEPTTLPFSIEYGFQPFIIIQPIRQIQIGLKMDYALSNLSSEFQNSLLSDLNYKLDINTKSYIPGVFTYLTVGKMKIGGGVLHSYTTINLNDKFFGYQAEWNGSNTGYELSLGFSSTHEKYFGYTIAIKYRNLFLNNLKDNLNREISYSDNNESMSLNMSGFFIEAGIYFQFVKLKKQKDEIELVK